MSENTKRACTRNDPASRSSLQSTSASMKAGSAVVVDNVGFSYGRHQILDSVSIPPLQPGTVTALVGPNGAGKSTLLRCMARMGRFSGNVSGPEPLYLPQDPPPPSSLTVFESVLLSKQQSVRGFAGMTVSEEARNDAAGVLEELGLEDLTTRTMAQLSGGQRQLVSFAQAIVRRPEALLLDEPTSALDMHNQLMLMHQIRNFALATPATVVVTVHDLGHAARFCDRVVILGSGTIHSQGTPKEAITETMLRDVYKVAGTVTPTADGGLAVEASQAL